MGAVPGARLISVTKGLKHGRSGWLLRWGERDHQWAPREKRAHWFVDYDEAIVVRDAMRAGESFEVAFRRVWV